MANTRSLDSPGFAKGNALAPARDSSGSSVESMFRAHYARLVQSLALVVDDKEEAADAVQEAFLALERRWPTVSGYEDPVGWVRRVALNRLLSVRRSIVRRAKALGRLDQHPATQHVPDGAVCVAVKDALKKLPRQQRTAVVFFYFADLSVSEIAASMDISEGSVNRHLHRARAALRRELEVEL